MPNRGPPRALDRSLRRSRSEPDKIRSPPGPSLTSESESRLKRIPARHVLDERAHQPRARRMVCGRVIVLVSGAASVYLIRTEVVTDFRPWTPIHFLVTCVSSVVPVPGLKRSPPDRTVRSCHRVRGVDENVGTGEPLASCCRTVVSGVSNTRAFSFRREPAPGHEQTKRVADEGRCEPRFPSVEPEGQDPRSR
jgi:hypothetical protein